MLIFLAMAKHESSHFTEVLLELVLGLVIGVAVAALVALAWRLPILTAEPRLQPLGPVAIAIVVYAICHLTHANPYLAAFAAGSALATLDHVAAETFEPFGDLLELTKFARAAAVPGRSSPRAAVAPRLAGLAAGGAGHRGGPPGVHVAVVDQNRHAAL